MKDGVIKGNGNSRYLKSIEDFKSVYPDYDAFAQALVDGTLPIDLNGINEAGWVSVGTPMNKGTLLSDETATGLGLDPDSDPTVDDALGRAVASSVTGTLAISPSEFTRVDWAWYPYAIDGTYGVLQLKDYVVLLLKTSRTTSAILQSSDSVSTSSTGYCSMLAMHRHTGKLYLCGLTTGYSDVIGAALPDRSSNVIAITRYYTSTSVNYNELFLIDLDPTFVQSASLNKVLQTTSGAEFNSGFPILYPRKDVLITDITKSTSYTSITFNHRTYSEDTSSWSSSAVSISVGLTIGTVNVPNEPYDEHGNVMIRASTTTATGVLILYNIESRTYKILSDVISDASGDMKSWGYYDKTDGLWHLIWLTANNICTVKTWNPVTDEISATNTITLSSTADEQFNDKKGYRNIAGVPGYGIVYLQNHNYLHVIGLDNSLVFSANVGTSGYGDTSNKNIAVNSNEVYIVPYNTRDSGYLELVQRMEQRAYRLDLSTFEISAFYCSHGSTTYAEGPMLADDKFLCIAGDSKIGTTLSTSLSFISATSEASVYLINHKGILGLKEAE